MAPVVKTSYERVGTTFRKGENAGYQHYLILLKGLSALLHQGC